MQDAAQALREASPLFDTPLKQLGATALAKMLEQTAKPSRRR